MGLTAIECPDGVCHSHHGGHAVKQSTMEDNLQDHGREWCERLAERIYEMSVDTFSQNVMPSLHAAGWQRRHLDWEFKLAEQGSEPDLTLVDGMINATESFLRSSEVHRLFIQELVQGTFAEATSDTLRINAVRELIESELLAMLAENREALLDRLSAKLIESAKGNSEMARQAADEGLDEVQRLLANHSEAL
ncbi:MAG: EF-1 guanine nucleotide exchange domain-containing protein [Prochlorococcus sp.]